MSAYSSPATSARPMLALPRGAEELEPLERRAVRAAMQAVYHYSIGGRLVVETAPAILVSTLSPLTLAEALAILAPSPTRLREAIWTIARSIPPAALADTDAHAGIDRYPPALLHVLTREDRARLGGFEHLRNDYCRRAELLSGAIVAFADRDDCWDLVEQVRELYGSPLMGCVENGLLAALPPGLVDARFTVMGFLEQVLGGSDPGGPCAVELRAFEREVGMPLAAFLRQFVDSIAFQTAFATDEAVQVFPAVSIAVQDTESLLTRVTVTSLVAGQSYANLARGMDPQCWVETSDAFRMSRYVEGPLDLVALEPPRPKGAPGPAPLYLEEDVVFLWGEEEDVGGSCRNVLRFDLLDFQPYPGSIDIVFELARSVESRLLWDVGPGGLLVDSGYLLARGVCEVPNMWRVTICKELLWSDRAPYAIGAGSGLGDALNYLAPATVSWWQETEMYSYTAVPGPP